MSISMELNATWYVADMCVCKNILIHELLCISFILHLINLDWIINRDWNTYRHEFVSFSLSVVLLTNKY